MSSKKLLSSYKSNREQKISKDSIKKKDANVKMKIDTFFHLDELLDKFSQPEISNEEEKKLRNEIVVILKEHGYKRFPTKKGKFNIYIKKLLNNHLFDIWSNLESAYHYNQRRREREAKKISIEKKLIDEKKNIILSEVKQYILEYRQVPHKVLDNIVSYMISVYDDKELGEKRYKELREALWDFYVGRIIDTQAEYIPDIIVEMIINDKLIKDEWGGLLPDGGLEELLNLFERAKSYELKTNVTERREYSIHIKK